ncbi:MAG: dihydroxyacetone kinase subunit DhaL [Eubacteriales bacterium]|nr:dihydroxyacetone kinase subunit DhaL [Eubacteriales bacterium]
MFKNAEGKSIVLNMAKAIHDNKAYLGEIDGLIGDGDHGMNMNKGFSCFSERFSDKKITFSEGLEELGMVLLNEIGGSMGPIYGTIFMEMADTANGADEIDLALFSKMLDAGMEGLFRIVDARVGDKTVVDTLSPACDVLHEALAAKKSFLEALENMKAAAIVGMESTKSLVAKFGRSSRLGERSRGVLDAGAVSCCIILCAMADGIKKLSSDQIGTI